MSYVLAIEPHQEQAGILRESVGSKTRAKLTVVDSIDAALTAINHQVPTLVLLSALTPPHEESQLIARLRRLPEASAPEILIIPALDGQGYSGTAKSSFLDRLRPRARSAACDPLAFANQLTGYLRDRKPAGPRNRTPLTVDAAAADRRIASRVERVDWATVMINGVGVNLVDLSATGAQVLASMVLMPRGSVDVSLARNGDLIRCEAGVVWGGFEIPESSRSPWYRAGIHFKDADRDAIERMFSASRQESLSILRKPVDRSQRAERHEQSETPWFTTATLPWGLELRVVNISSTGLLLESGCRLDPGRVTAITLRGAGREQVVGASIVRSEVAEVTTRGVKYHVAVTFDPTLQIPEAPSESRAIPFRAKKTLGNLLAQISADLDRGSRLTRREVLERNIRQVVPAREIVIRDQPIAAGGDGLSMSFSAPTATGKTATVQALFDRGSEPTELDLKLLRAAAGLAAVVLEFDDDVPGASAQRPAIRALLMAHAG
jgi:hypothetical protein